MRLLREPFALLVLLGLLAACGSSDAGPGPDGSVAPPTEAGVDAGGPDANGPDATLPDAGKDGAAPDAGPPEATLADFEAKRAYFVFETKFNTPSDNGTGFQSYNVNQDVVVKDGTWYLFTREFGLNRPAYCTADYARTVVRASTDHGKTWGPKTVIVDNVPGSPTECTALDGDVFYDAAADTWHFIYQCLTRTGPWNMCYSSHKGPTPVARFDDSPQNPVVHGGDLWKKITGTTTIHDEGTPEIVSKVGADFFVTFHGFDGTNGYRGVAKTQDFVTWSTANGAPIFSKADCASWNVPWLGGCIGGGASTTFEESGTFYMLIESADLSLGCTPGQDWVFGLMKATSLPQTPYVAVDAPGIFFNTHELQASGQWPPCGVQYARLFRDETGAVHLLASRSGVLDPVDLDPVLGHYQFLLTKGAPFAKYAFREGRDFVSSDVVSRGYLEASAANVTWLKGAPGNAAVFDGATSIVQMPNNPLFARDGDYRIELAMRFDALPVTAKSAFVAGVPQSYWMELYPDGNLCAFMFEKGTVNPKSACAVITAELGKDHVFAAELAATELRLLQDGSKLATSAVGPGGPAASTSSFRVGSTGPNAAGFYASFAGQVTGISVFDHAP